MTTEDRIKDIVAGIVHCNRDAITPASTFKDIKADSLDLVQIVIATESAFDIEIPDEDIQKLHTFGDFVAQIEKIIGGKNGT